MRRLRTPPNLPTFHNYSSRTVKFCELTRSKKKIISTKKSLTIASSAILSLLQCCQFIFQNVISSYVFGDFRVKSFSTPNMSSLQLLLKEKSISSPNNFWSSFNIHNFFAIILHFLHILSCRILVFEIIDFLK